MKRFFKYSFWALVLAGFVAALLVLKGKWKGETPDVWRTAKTSRGTIVALVNSTGTIDPVLKVSVGSFVSGPIIELYVGFNQVVKKGDLLARVDPRIPASNLARAEAALATRVAEVERSEALLNQAIRDERRSVALQNDNPDFISPKEMDAFHYNRLSLEAQLQLAEAAVSQAKADVENAEANLGYTEIRSPVDGMVIERKIEPGATLASSFQTPELFILGVDMEKKVHVAATVDEADIGLLQQAQTADRPVEFRVDAYPDELFVGSIEQIRKNATTVQNVVTYPVIVSAPNPDLKLFPGMTASLSFEVDRRTDVIRVPNSALRFFPRAEDVREQDRKLIEGDLDEDSGEDSGDDSGDGAFDEERNNGPRRSDEDEASFAQLSSAEVVQANRKRRERHVWVVDGEKLRAIAVVTGLSDARYSELVSGELEAGVKLVTGLRNEAR